MRLNEAVEQLVKIGESDPLTIARKILKEHDAEWVREELEGLAEDIIAEYARRELGSRRRSAELALQPGNPMAQGDLQLAKVWIPGEGWKRAADLTADDLRKRASWYDLLVRAAHRRAAWCREVAGMMEDEGVDTLGKLKADLPALPDDGDDMLDIEAA